MDTEAYETVRKKSYDLLFSEIDECKARCQPDADRDSRTCLSSSLIVVTYLQMFVVLRLNRGRALEILGKYSNTELNPQTPFKFYYIYLFSYFVCGYMYACQNIHVVIREKLEESFVSFLP